MNFTEHAVLDLLYNIVLALETIDKACSIFLDFAKAFDILNHNILLSKLECYGVLGLPLKHMNCYHSDKTQCVKIGGSTSKHAPKHVEFHREAFWGHYFSLFILTIYINQTLKILSIYLWMPQAFPLQTRI